jgi:hypothetical protein
VKIPLNIPFKTKIQIIFLFRGSERECKKIMPVGTLNIAILWKKDCNDNKATPTTPTWKKKSGKKAAVKEAPLLLKIKQAINKTTNNQQPTTPLLYNA